MFKRLIMGSLVSVLASANYADTKNFDEVVQDVRILTQVLKTSINNSSMDRQKVLSNINATYLANQGVVFTVRIRRAPGEVNFIIPPMPPLPIDVLGLDGIESPVIAEGMMEGIVEGLREIPQEIDEQMIQEIELDLEDSRYLKETQMQDLLERREAIRERQEELREQRQQIRDEQRDLRDRVRELQREVRSSDNEQERRQAAIEVERMQRTMGQLSARLQGVNKNYQEQMELFKKRKEEKINEQQKQWQQYIARIENTLTDTLCRYGGSLKTIPDNEYVSIVMSKADRSESKPKDRIHIYKKSDLVACQREIISTNQLQTRSEVYSY